MWKDRKFKENYVICKNEPNPILELKITISEIKILMRSVNSKTDKNKSPKLKHKEKKRIFLMYRASMSCIKSSNTTFLK